MAAWQIVLGLFFTLLPIMLMLDFWGDERVDARGYPRQRSWSRHKSERRIDAESAYHETVVSS